MELSFVNILGQKINANQKIPVMVDDSTKVFEFPTYSRGYHAYMNDWPNPLIGDVLTGMAEPNNTHDANAVAIIREDANSKITVGHAPFSLSAIFKRFLTLPGSQITFTVSGKRVNRGGGYGLEIPVLARLSGPTKGVDWAQKKVEAVFKDQEARSKKCGVNTSSQ